MANEKIAGNKMVYTYVDEEFVLFNDEDIQIFVEPANGNYHIKINALSPAGIWRNIATIHRNPPDHFNEYKVGIYIKNNYKDYVVDKDWNMLNKFFPDINFKELQLKYEGFMTAVRMLKAK